MAAELLKVSHLTVKFGGLTAVNDVDFSIFPNLSVLETIRTGHHLEEKETLWDVVFNTGRKRSVEEETLARTLEILKFIGLEEKKEAMANNLPYGEQRL